jgi:hypothetical protein
VNSLPAARGGPEPEHSLDIVRCRQLGGHLLGAAEVGPVDGRPVQRVDLPGDWYSIPGFAWTIKVKRSTKFVVAHNGREYDSKALLAAAHGFQHPDKGPLPNNFSGGEQTTARFRALGFTVVFPTAEILADVRSSFGE